MLVLRTKAQTIFKCFNRSS